MFGFSLAAQLFQGSAQRTWNCVTQFTNLIWYKFNHIRHPIMPRSRRRHHSRSRSRSRSHSHDRDREAKRRKIDSLESPTHKRSVSCEPQSPAEKVEEVGTTETVQEVQVATSTQADTEIEEKTAPVVTQIEVDDKTTPKKMAAPLPITSKLEEKLLITPKKAMSPKQLQKKLESEKKRQQKQLEREEREKKKQEEKERLRLEKEKQKQEKEKERQLKEEQKRKEREEKEAKRKEKEEREEQKRKEREQEKLRKQQEIDEKNKEKQKLEEQKQKAAAAFANFFVPKKLEVVKIEEAKSSIFMPFQAKSDMRLAPKNRRILTEEEKKGLGDYLQKPNEDASYLIDLKNGKSVGKCPKTWPYEEDVVIIEEDFGVSIDEDENKAKSERMKAKFLKFRENRRPPYFGTWRKKSKVVKARRPFAEDSCFNYEVDSDDDWEEEEQGESLSSDDEEKENETEEDYEVDNDFFVPHGHLSDDEVDDEATSKLSPESQKQKLKLLKDEFDQDMQMKTHKMKPRSIGCIWYKKDGSNVDEAIDRHLRPLAMITNGQIIIKKRSDLISQTPSRKYAKELREDLIPAFVKMIHGNVSKRTMVVDDFINYMQNNGYTVEVSKAYLGKRLKQFAQWKKCTEEGPMLNKFCWCVEDDVKKKYNVV